MFWRLNVALALLSLSLISCSDPGDGPKIATLVNEGATQMLEGHVSEKIVIYHPDAGAGTYTIKLEKHFACTSSPCDAPAGQKQGLLRFVKEGGNGSGGELERWISVSQPFEVTRKDQDTAIILQNKGWYAEVRAVY
jgi:hypothetical protein